MLTYFFVIALIVLTSLTLCGIVIVAKKAIVPAINERRELDDLQRVVIEAGQYQQLPAASNGSLRRWLKSLTKEERISLRAICVERLGGGYEQQQATRSAA